MDASHLVSAEPGLSTAPSACDDRMTTPRATPSDDRHFALDLAGLIVRVFAAAIAINIVLGGLVLMLAAPNDAQASAFASAAGSVPAGQLSTNTLPASTSITPPSASGVH